MKNFNMKILVLFLSMLILFGIFLVPMNKETGYIHEGVYKTYERNLEIQPIWKQAYSVEVREGNYNREKYTSTEVNQYVHSLLLVIITLGFTAIYVLHNKK